MNILGGKLKGRKLVSPVHVRATGSKVRQAIFNILSAVMADARFLDGFSGSGAIGCEAFSRGAAFVTFIDNHADSIVSVRDNLSVIEKDIPPKSWRVIHMDINRGIEVLAAEKTQFDIILLDPPYEGEDGKKALMSISDCDILATSGILGIEHHRRSEYPERIGSLQMAKQHRYGDTVLSFYRFRG